MACLLLASVFVTSLAMADESNASVEESELIEASEIEVEDTNESEVEDVLKEVSDEKDYKKLGFIVVRRGSGWIENGEEGMLISGFWASQRFVKDQENETRTDSQKGKYLPKPKIKHGGIIHIAGAGSYRVIKALEESNETIEELESISFNVIPLLKKGEKWEGVENAIENSIGTFTLDVENKYESLTTFSGTLELDEEKAQGTWDVTFATNVKRVNPAVYAITQDANRAAKKSFWKRIQFWKRNK